MQISETKLPDVFLIEPRRIEDERGYFNTIWNQKSWAAAGLKLPAFVQENQSLSRHTGTLRGLHFQSHPKAQGKLVRCGKGTLFDVAVDIRNGSPTFGEWFGVMLSAENGRQLWIPAGFLHGFVTRDENTEIIYKCTDDYAPECEGSVRWDSLGIAWDVADPVLSDKDRDAPRFCDFTSPFEWSGDQ